MAEGVRDFSDLKTTLIKAKVPEAPQAVAEGRPKLDRQGRAYATGKRKNAVARVWLKPGPGRIIINGKEETTYCARPVLRMILRQPLVAAARDGQFDVICTVVGGGLSGQAGAVRHGISKALIAYEPNLRPVLKQGGYVGDKDLASAREILRAAALTYVAAAAMSMLDIMRWLRVLRF